ncbi:MAG: TetR/AcrR family transcriptional regulator [Rhizobiales bacterium]|nr:TetR/AcrR family transcriptional regulator [Hyphomicrobiales bacterium]
MRSPRNVHPSLDCAYGHCAKRLSITEAAELVFASEGYAAASIDMIASRAGVSRQTIYNHYGDKASLFVAVVRDLTERSNAGLFQVIASFPDRPADLEAELAEFAFRLMRNCMCNREGKSLRRLIEAEGERYPELFAAWREEGPGRGHALIGSRFAALDHAGWLHVDDPERAARQFMALVFADIQMVTLFGGTPNEAQIRESARNGVKSFLAAYGTRSPAGHQAAPQPGDRAVLIAS